ncbi:MAG: FAD:protein FMN transferase [Candidatus Levyibacteriota bacterium]
MKETRSIMGMHVTVEIAGSEATEEDLEDIFEYFTYIDNAFSTYKDSSEISRINRGELKEKEYSADMKTILRLCEETKKDTNGYFNIEKDGILDPSGIVKGWAIWQAAKLLEKKGFNNFYVDAGGDIQVAGKKYEKPWIVGIRNPFKEEEVIKVLELEDKGIATSGTSMRGQHIYNPLQPGKKLEEIVSITVIGPNVYEADRFATAAFAMQKEGIMFIEELDGFEGYAIDRHGIAIYTGNFEQYVQKH